MLVIDTSVLLNLLGSCHPKLLLSHVPVGVVVPAVVLREVQYEPKIEVESDANLYELIDGGFLQIVEANNQVESIALALAGSASPDDLDDGEAYSIAQAVELNAMLAIDERKGRRIATKMFPALDLLFTIDLIERSAMRAKLSETELCDIVYSALRHSRMRIPSDRRDWVISLVGRERARSCPSLGYVSL